MSETILLSIVLPTYNEKENVSILVDRIRETFINQEHIYELLFVDDSNDGTAEIVQSLAKSDLRIKLIEGRRAGLADAFILGFESAQGKYICCMDTDLQHPPETILSLLENSQRNNTDIVVASRYANGGSAVGLGSKETSYGFYRHFISFGMKLLTQIMFIPTRKTSDPLGGFFVFKKSILEGVILEPRGFKILVEILMRARYGSVSDVPYIFLPRENNDSKASMWQGIEYLRHLFYLFRTVPEVGRFLKFCIVGGSGVVLNTCIIFVLVEYFQIGKNISWTISAVVVVLSNYVLNSIFTYNDNKSITRLEILRRLSNYYMISLIGLAINFMIYSLGRYLGLYYLVASFMGVLLATVVNFILVTKIVWKFPKRVSL